MPTLLKFTRESDSRLRAASLTALHQIIKNLDAAGLSEQVCEQNAEYLLKVSERNVFKIEWCAQKRYLGLIIGVESTL